MFRIASRGSGALRDWAGPGRRLDLISAGLFLAMLVRTAALCLATPIVGYGNNLDFFRQSACVGLWEAYGDRPKMAADTDRPVNDLVYDGNRVGNLCMRSSDNLFPWVAAHLHHRDAHVQLREIGALKMAVTALLALYLLLQPVGAAFRLANALAFFLVFGDIAVGCYFNTLYVDASGIIATTLAVAAAATLCARARPPPWRYRLVAAALIVWLGSVKPQYSPLAALLGMVDALFLVWIWRDRVGAAFLGGITLAATLAFGMLNAAPDGILRTASRVNLADTFLEAVLPQATDRMGALHILRLPDRCLPAIGKSGYSPEIVQGTQCPEIGQASRLRLLPLFVAQPQTFLQPFEAAVQHSRPAFLEYLQPFERSADAGLWRFRWLRASSVSVRLAALPYPFYRAVILSACVSGLVGVAGLALMLLRRNSRRSTVVPGLALAALGGSVCAYGLISAVFGDGYSEMARHEVTVLVGFAFWAAGGLLMSLNWLERVSPHLTVPYPSPRSEGASPHSQWG